MRPIYLNDWAVRGEEGMLEDFGISKDALKGASVLIASYTYEDYCGSAYVLFERNGKLFEVHGSHCSCYGLSESCYDDTTTTTQWQPEEVEIAAIRHRLKGSWGEEDRIKKPLLEVLDRLERHC